MLYICKDCGHIFHESRAKIHIEKCSEEVWGSRQSWTETYALCPECKSEDISAYYGELQDGDNIADESTDEDEI